MNLILATLAGAAVTVVSVTLLVLALSHIAS